MQTQTSRDVQRYLSYFGVSIFFAYLIPLHVKPFPSFYNEWVVAFGVVILFGAFFKQRVIDFRLPSIGLLPLGLIASICLQAILGMLSAPGEIFLSICYLLLATAAIIAGATIAAKENGAVMVCNAISWAHLAAGLASALIAWMQIASVEHLFLPFAMLMDHSVRGFRPHANIAQSNHLALLCCLAVAGVWWLWQNSRLRSLVAVIFTVMLISGAVLAQSRIAWIIFPLYVIFSLIWRRKSGMKPIPALLPLGFLTSFAVMTFALPLLSEFLGTATSGPLARATEGYSVRGALYKQAFSMTLSHPWFGIGWQQFGPEQLSVALDVGGNVYSRHSHNLFLNMMAELGFPVTVAAIALTTLWLVSLRSKPITSHTGFFFLFAAAIAVHSMLEFPLWYSYVLIPLSLLAGMVHQEFFLTNAWKLSRNYLGGILAISLGFLLFVAEDYRKVAAGFSSMEFASAGFAVNQEAMEKPAFTLLPYMFDYYVFLDTPIEPDLSNKKLSAMNATVQRFVGPARLNRMAQIFAINNREQDAVKTLSVLHRFYPDRYPHIYKAWQEAPDAFQAVSKMMPVPAAVHMVH